MNVLGVDEAGGRFRYGGLDAGCAGGGFFLGAEVFGAEAGFFLCWWADWSEGGVGVKMHRHKRAACSTARTNLRVTSGVCGETLERCAEA